MISVLRSVLDNITCFGGCSAPKQPSRGRLLPILAVLGNMALAVFVASHAHAQTGNTTIQPDCLIPFTFTAAGNFPATNVTGGAGDNRTKGCAAWTLMYQSTGLVMVSVTLQSGSSVSTTVSYGAFAGTISTGYVNPIVSDTGGSLQATNGTADISWVRVNVVATGSGTLTGVLYGFRNSSAAVNSGGGGGTCPQGATGSIQYSDGTDCQGSAISTQLADFTIVRTSATRLTIGPYCTTTAPCSWIFGSAWNTGKAFALTGPITLDVAAGFGAGKQVLISLGADGNLHITTGNGDDTTKLTCTAPAGVVGCTIEEFMNERQAAVSLNFWSCTIDGVWNAAADLVYPQWSFVNGGGVTVNSNKDDGPTGNASTFQGAVLNFQPGSNITWTIQNDLNNITVEAQPNVSLTPTFTSEILNGDVANPFKLAKTTQSASAPGAGFANLRWVAGTNAGTCKLVSNAGTSATEVTIVDNVGGGC